MSDPSDLVLFWYWRHYTRYVDQCEDVEDAVGQAWENAEAGTAADFEVEIVHADGSSERFDPKTHPSWGLHDDIAWATTRQREAERAARLLATVMIDDAAYDTSPIPEARETADKLRSLLGDRVTVRTE